MCWEDDNTDAMHFMELQDSQGSVVLTVEVNGDCVTEVIQAGDYVMSIHHDGSIADSLPIFLIPDPEDSEQARKSDGLIDRFKLAASNIIKQIEDTVTNDAQAQVPSVQTPTVKANIQTLLSTRSCEGCDLRRARLFKTDLSKVNLSGANLDHADFFEANLSEANLSEADLTGADFNFADLRGADLREAILKSAILIVADLRGADLRGANLFIADLRDADLRGADLRGADLSGAAWCDLRCFCSEGSIGTCNGCPPVEDVCTGP